MTILGSGPDDCIFFPLPRAQRERPHQALANATPAERYAASPRRFDGFLREPEYSAEREMRRVRSNGEIKWRGKLVHINGALTGEPVGLTEAADGAWEVHYGPVALGLIARMAAIA